jgi:hypothetical protein
MIKLVDPGERGGELTVSMTPFDLLSLKQMTELATIHINEAIEKTPEELWKEAFRARLKDCKWNMEELTAVEKAREEALGVNR